MRSPLRAAYDALARVAEVAVSVAPQGDSKTLRGLYDRRGLLDRYRAWAGQHRDPSRPLVWMHAPSVGEGLQARPVLQRLRTRVPDTQLAYTWFSPSAVQFGRSLDVDFRDYLAIDSPGNASAMLDALRPSVIVFSKLDVWPNLVAEAARRGVRLAMVSATLAEGSSRTGRLAAALLSDAYAALDAVGAIDAADADRLVGLGVRRGVIEVTGDTRYDQVWDRAQRVDRTSGSVARLASSRPTIVAGSTWPADEAVLLDAFSELRKLIPAVQLIIAPHEPTPAHLEPVVAWCGRAGLHTALLETATADDDVVVVDRVGVLGDLYALADVAFVGGGFHRAGLHSVLEPAAFGAPVSFGPMHRGSRDAGLLIAAGGGASASTSRELAATLSRWLGDPAALSSASTAARYLVRNGIGAADRATELVLRLIGPEIRQVRPGK